ncbi:hypothetical protein [Teredinibacter sp. KSP-S5-2]|uniref:hypothetical protein n=1 Tax=Teredinibacter sp. KSP-S5-2 TaxID=3034506 RepID=UPI0029344057|nr:hypothetical protein [Teredinibacter sp. KSP-S5-2]WNO10457.1 hypothetical protein P5V12_04660 [Teredinibacter sp. KSP-S5-2]
MDSPTKRLHAQCLTLLNEKLPTKVYGLLPISASLPMEVQITESTQFQFAIDHVQHVFQLPRTALEFLWVATYSYLSLYEQVEQTKEKSKFIYFHLSDNNYSILVELLRRARARLNSSYAGNWNTLGISTYPIENTELIDSVYLRCIEYKVLPLYLDFLSLQAGETDVTLQHAYQRDLTGKLLISRSQRDTDDRTNGFALFITSLLTITQNTLIDYTHTTLVARAVKTTTEQMTSILSEENHSAYQLAWVLFHAHCRNAIPVLPKSARTKLSQLRTVLEDSLLTSPSTLRQRKNPLQHIED